MATELRNVTGYHAWLVDLWWGWEAPNLFCHAVLDVATDKGLVQCVFYETTQDKLPPALVKKGTCRRYYTADRYAMYLDLLRNEGPLVFEIQYDRKRLRLRTKGWEAPGEGEDL